VRRAVTRPAWVRLPRTPRSIALTVWAVALIVDSSLWGLPLSRISQTVWILLALFAVNLGRPWRAQARVAVDWIPFAAFLYLYDWSRGWAAVLNTHVHVTESLNAEKWLFHGIVPTVWLQQHFYVPAHVQWYDVIISLVYFSHFFVVWVFAAVLYVRSRHEWARWARRILALSYAGLITFVIYPTAPPWYASQVGLIPNVHRLATRGWDAIGLGTAGSQISHGQSEVNNFAAVPSLHASFAALLTVFVWPKLGPVGRSLMVLYTTAMLVTLVYSGEHYVVDALVGYAYVAAVVLGCSWWERWRQRRRPVPGEAVSSRPPEEHEPASLSS
jgi:PAP2 superfamily